MLPVDENTTRTLLRAFILDKALYELGYELNNRPEWVHVPIEGLLRLLPGAPVSSPATEPQTATRT